YAKKHPTTFKIPDGTFEDSEMSDVVTTFIKENLTTKRGSMKQKINHSLKTKVNISVLAKSLASTGHEVTAAHWARFAFLVSTSLLLLFDSAVAVVENRDSEIIDSPKAPGPGPATSDNAEPNGVTVADTIEKARNWVSTEYWEFVDILLRDVRQEARTIGKTLLEREKIVETFFMSCLQDDMKRYSSTHSLIPTFDKVTVHWQKAIHTGLIW
ncbi:uncharacterized protein F5891DRAFT_944132, partial [Suillus fuscotomentosus]